ncbi:MAG TPA: hypothetical protein VFP84_10600 [Kofleriaceae bacterium]|nr:hypothetical protein [Kofleriaceae bacterium]
MAVVLESRLRRMQVFNLPHESFCRAQCACTKLALTVIAENPRTGERAPKHLTKRIPGSLTLLALERKGGLANAVLEVPELEAAVRAGHVRVLEQTAEPSQVPSADASMSTGASMSAAPPPPAAPPQSAASPNAGGVAAQVKEP